MYLVMVITFMIQYLIYKLMTQLGLIMYILIPQRFSNDFKSVIGIPKDSKRLDVDENDIDQYFADIEQAIQEVYPYFVYNLDKAGVSSRVCSCKKELWQTSKISLNL